MSIRILLAASWAAACCAGAAFAYPGGTPSYQTDVAPFCAGCHSSRAVEALAGAGERADKEVAESKHLALVLAGRGPGYEALGESDRKTLVEQIRALDAASTVTLVAPAKVKRDQTFEVTVEVTGGAGPVAGVALVDRAHRWYARPATAAGWTVAGAPRITGADGQPANDWLERRPAEFGRALGFVNAPIESDSAAGRWGRAQVVFTLRAPNRPGPLPLAAAYLYGTEKSTILGYTTNALGYKQVRGGTGGHSGRVLFTPVRTIEVE